MWIYQETDGYDGLQWGPVCSDIVPNDCDDCMRSGIPENDSLIV